MHSTKEVRNLGIVALSVLSLPSLGGCSTSNATNPSSPDLARAQLNMPSVIDVGNGIYRMRDVDYTSPEVQALRLATFRKDHPNLRIMSIAKIDNPGTDEGNILIVTENKK